MPNELAPTGHTIFCDDIRLEQSGQISLIGIYPGGMLVHTPFPVTLPRFAFSIAFNEPRELAMKRDFVVNLNIYLPGDAKPSYLAEVPAQSQQSSLDTMWLQHLPFHKLAGEEPEPHLTTLINMTTAPMVLREPGLIRVRITYRDKVIRCGTLKIAAAIASPGNAPQQTELGQPPS